MLIYGVLLRLHYGNWSTNMGAIHTHATIRNLAGAGFGWCMVAFS